MKIVTWNINSVRARLERAVSWLTRHQPDLVCLQETKVTDDLFPKDEFERLGYSLEFFGQKSYNGVAMLAKGPLDAVHRGMPGDDDGAQRRVISATFRGIRVINVYVPNGAQVGSESYAMKLEWLDRLFSYATRDRSPEDPVMICGDFNIAPEDQDVHDPARWRGKVLCSEPEREKFRAFEAWGFKDALRLLSQDPGVYTWWDYRMGGFRRDWGLRIDHFLVTPALAGRVEAVSIDREERGGDKPSDHAPVTAVVSE